MSERGPIRVSLVAEHAVLRQNLELLLEAEGMVLCGAPADPAAAGEGAPAEADLVILCLSAGRSGALGLLRDLASRPGAPAVLVLSVNDDALSIREAFALGARGYVPSRTVCTALLHAIREVAAGRTYAPPLASESSSAALGSAPSSGA